MAGQSAAEQTYSMAGYPYTDIVDFVERTTYEIWNDRKPDLVMSCYTPATVIWGDGGDLAGDAAVTQNTRDRQAQFPDYRGVISDTIWTGCDQQGYRTSMRWVSRGTHLGQGWHGAPTGRGIVDSCIANCVVLGDQYIEEWAGGNGLADISQLGLNPADFTAQLTGTSMPAGEAGRQRTRELGATVPAIPATVDGAGLFVQELLDQLYNRRDLSVITATYAPGAPYTFGATRYETGHDGIRSEVSRWLDLLPDLSLSVEELYWHEDAPARSRVAVRYRITGTGTGESGREHPVALTGIHHVHVRGGLVVAEWAEYDELALQAQLR